jgi:hypothetical protein
VTPEELDVELRGLIAFQSDDSDQREHPITPEEAAENGRDRMVDRDAASVDVVGQLPAACPAHVERQRRRSVQQRAEHARHRATEAR